MYRAFAAQRRRELRRLAQADCLISIVDVLSNAGLGLREKMKRSGRILAVEGDRRGWRCRIVIENDSRMLPPSSPRLGFHVPMTAGNIPVGALIVTAPRQDVDDVEQNFFEIVARSLGQYVFKEKTWEHSHSEPTRRQAALLLQGSVEHSVDNKL